MLGPLAVALATELNKELGLSPQKTAKALGRFGIRVTAGGVVQAVARQARALEPTCEVLIRGCAPARRSRRMRPAGGSTDRGRVPDRARRPGDQLACRAGTAPSDRESWGGNRTPKGARTQQITMSVIRTARQQDIDPLELMASAQRSRQPAASELITLPARASPTALAA